MGGCLSGRKPPSPKYKDEVKSNNKNNQATKNRINEQDKAILDIKTRLRKLKTYVDKLRLQSQDYENKAKTYLKEKNKGRALLALKQKKFFDKELSKA